MRNSLSKGFPLRSDVVIRDGKPVPKNGD